jgi:hypothetical protein
MRRRTILGFICAPLVVSLGMGAKAVSALSVRDPRELVVTFLAWYFYAAIFTVVFALPMFILLRRFRLLRWWIAMAAGLLIGCLGAVTIGTDSAAGVCTLALLGAGGGAIFWLIARDDLLPNNRIERPREA